MCSDTCKLSSDGCCQAGGSGAGAAVLAFGIGALLRRRRR
jgi:uncharacterized protein (TIGR03382 family)